MEYGEIISTYRPCYASIVCKTIRGKLRVYLHLTVEGLPFPKRTKNGVIKHSCGDGIVGCDIRTQTIAYTSDHAVGLENLAERGNSIRCVERQQQLVQRAMDRLHRLAGSISKFRQTIGSSQYDHTADVSIKKKLSQRMYNLKDGTKVQRDWYSSFLLYCIDLITKTIDRQKCLATFETQLNKEQDMIEEIIRSRKHVKNSGIRAVA